MLLLLAYAGLATWLIVRYDGTGDSGDSVMHYLYARHAPAHPALFFDHWAKPLFVLLAAPFAQAGFIGMKVFNALASATTLMATYGIARKAGLRMPVLAPVLLLCAPQFLVLTFSGLTEPLFAFGLAWCLLLSMRGQDRAAALILSFLPFVRSEGLIIIGVFALYLLLTRRARILPLLFVGSVAYGLAGWPVHGDPFWPFTAIPYARLSSTYGSGTPWHFVEEFVQVLGVPGYGLFVGGLLSMTVRLVRDRRPEALHLPVACLLAFVLAHSLFWWLGIFNSMGLGRVLVCVAPIAAVVALHGLERLVALVPERPVWARRCSITALVAYVLIFPFTPNPAAIVPERELALRPDQLLAIRTVHAVRPLMQQGGRVFSAHPMFPLLLDIDPFDPQVHVRTSPQLLEQLRPGDLVLWDGWFCPVETGVSEEMLERGGLFKVVGSDTVDHRGRAITQAAYLRLPSDPTDGGRE